MPSFPPYTHSGHYEGSGLIVALLVSVAIAAAISPIYAIAIYYIPFIYVIFFITFGYGFAVGYGTSYGFRIGKVRSLALVSVSAVGVAVVADYLGWVSWFFVATHRLIIRPSDLLDAIGLLAATGSWSIEQSKPTGTFLYIIWFAELFAISLLAVLAARTTLGEHVFCEQCSMWLPEPTKIGPLEPLAPEALSHATPDILQSLRPIAAPSPEATFVELRTCPHCRNLHVLSVKLVTTSTDEQGKQSSRERVIIPNAHASAALAQALLLKQGRA